MTNFNLYFIYKFIYKIKHRNYVRSKKENYVKEASKFLTASFASVFSKFSLSFPGLFIDISPTKTFK